MLSDLVAHCPISKGGAKSKGQGEGTRLGTKEWDDAQHPEAGISSHFRDCSCSTISFLDVLSFLHLNSLAQ